MARQTLSLTLQSGGASMRREVEIDDAIAGRHQALDQVRADEPGAAGDQERVFH